MRSGIQLSSPGGLIRQLAGFSTHAPQLLQGLCQRRHLTL